MKNILTALLFLSLLSMASCTKTGPQGPAGMGAKVKNITVTASDWVQYGTSGQAGAHVYYRLQTSDVDSSCYSSGTVLVYRSMINTLQNGGWRAIPYSYTNPANISFDWTYTYAPGYVDIEVYLSDLHFMSAPQLDYYKVVIVPGMYKTAPCDYSDYNAVKAYFHLKD